VCERANVLLAVNEELVSNVINIRASRTGKRNIGASSQLTPFRSEIRYDTGCYFNVRSKADISQQVKSEKKNRKSKT